MPSPLVYHSSYLNSTVAVHTAGHQLVGLVAGKHERNFPYFHGQCEWDNLLLYIDGVGYAHSARDMAGLHIEQNEHRTLIAFEGQLRGSDHTLHHIELALWFTTEPDEMYPQGKLWDWGFVPGMRWRPSYLVLEPAPSKLVVDGRALPLQRGSGELEHGELANLTWRSFAFCYDYTCLVEPHAGQVLIDFVTRALTRRNALERSLDWYLRRTGSLTLTLGPGAAAARTETETETETETDDDRDEDEDVEVLVEDRVDLGLAWLDRQLVRTRAPQGRALIGLREIFHPRAG